jgi:integrating conjugative element membrane protein (TIGR03747 family)
MATAARPAAAPVASPSDQGPIGFVFAMAIGTAVTILFSWFLSICIETVGSYTFWKDHGAFHSRTLVIEDLGYIAAAPHSLLVPDTVAFARDLIERVSAPFIRLGVITFYQRTQAEVAALRTGAAPANGKGGVANALKRTSLTANQMLSRIAVIAMFTAQDTVLRLAIVIFALPAFALACLLGAVDGLVRRDLRKWGGGRESSFIYHHAKATTYMVLGGGFALYLAWPFGGFNPAHMVLTFTFLVAWFLSLTLSSFKKYL